MNDAQAMRFFEHVADLRRDLDGARGGESSFMGECLRQSFTFHELHHDEVAPVGQITGVEDHRCVLMTQLGHRPCFAQKSICDVGIADELALDDLDRYWPFETQMRGKVDSTHATGPDFALD